MKNLRQNRGYTLVEMVIAVVIIGVLAALAVPTFLAMTAGKNLKNSTRYLASDLRNARYLAIAQKQPFGIVFDSANKKYTLFLDKVNLANCTFEVGDSVLQITFLEYDVAYGACTFANNTIVFKANGTGSSSGQVNLHTDDNSQSLNVDVLSSTGRIKIL